MWWGYALLQVVQFKSRSGSKQDFRASRAPESREKEVIM